MSCLHSRSSLHVAQLDDDTPANMALQLHINVSLNRPPDCMWRRPPGRPWNKWLDQLRNDSIVTALAGYATTMMMMMSSYLGVVARQPTDYTMMMMMSSYLGVVTRQLTDSEILLLFTVVLHRDQVVSQKTCR